MAFPGRFRVYTAITIVFTSILAISGFSYVSAVVANEPTPWMGLVERIAVYGPIVWTAVFALALWSRAEEAGSPP